MQRLVTAAPQQTGGQILRGGVIVLIVERVRQRDFRQIMQVRIQGTDQFPKVGGPARALGCRGHEVSMMVYGFKQGDFNAISRIIHPIRAIGEPARPVRRGMDKGGHGP